MKFALFGYQISIVSLNAVRRVEALARTYVHYGESQFSTKICRIKAYREIFKEESLKVAKDWVEANFVD